MSLVVVRGLVLGTAVVTLTGCFGSGARCNAPAEEDLVGAVSRVNLDGRAVGTTAVGYVADVQVQGGALMLVDEAGDQTQVALAQGPRRRVPAGLRTFGTRLEGVDGERLLWTQKGAGGAGIGRVGTTAVVLGQDKQLRGVGLPDGRLVWNSRLDHRLLAQDARVIGDLAVLAGQQLTPGESFGPGVAAALAVETGAVAWSTPLPEFSPSGASLLTGRADVAVVGAGERLVGLNLRDGRRLWGADLELPGDQVLRALDVDKGAFVAVTSQAAIGCD